MAHEEITRERPLEVSSDRSFGLVFGVVFFVVSAWPLVYGGSPRWWAAGVASAFVLVALVKPSLLARLNRLWAKFGILLGKVFSPIALGVLFYGVLTPIGVMMRILGKDPLRLRRDPVAQSYWQPRQPPGPPPDSMTNQF
jgi:Saxitoxin biosynthesis operon protein SxtJ